MKLGILLNRKLGEEIEMVGTVIRRMLKREPKYVAQKPVLVAPVSRPDFLQISQTNIWKDPEKLLGKDVVTELNVFVNNLMRFQYASCPFKALAVPKFENLPDYYTKVMYQKTTNNCWGEYIMSSDPFGNLFMKITEEKFFFKPLEDSGGRYYCKPLGVVAEKVVNDYYTTHYFSDVRHLLYLKKHPNEVPMVMKNGKGNLFAGTTIMVNHQPHMLVATWKGSSFEVELVSLKAGLEDTAQFVMIRRQ